MVSASTRRRLERMLVSRRPRPVGDRVVALCYHSIAADGPASIAPPVFRDHVAWIREHCDVVPFGALREANARSTAPRVAITFDDGYADNFERALPALTEHRLPATFFLTTGLLDRDPAATGRLARAWGVGPSEIVGLTWGQVDEMRHAGMELGAHTVTHPSLGRITPDAARAEVVDSKRTLEARLGEEVAVFAYPFGDARFDVSAATRRIVASAGFRAAGTIEFRGVTPGRDIMAMPRFPVVNESIDVLAGMVDGRLDVLGIAREHAPRWISRLASTGRRRGDDAA